MHSIPPTHLADKSIIITGGASGIGAAAIVRAVARGVKIMIADRDEAHGGQILAQMLADGGTAQFVRTEIGDAVQVEALVDTAVSAYGRLDTAFTNTGVPAFGHRGEGNAPTYLLDLPSKFSGRGLKSTSWLRSCA